LDTKKAAEAKGRNKQGDLADHGTQRRERKRRRKRDQPSGSKPLISEEMGKGAREDGWC